MSSSQMNTLTDQFNNLISQYQDTYKNFINTINSGDNSLTSVSDSAYVGENNINTIQNSSVNDCVTSCSSTQSCSGATFNQQQNTCTLSSGNGNIINSPNNTAIVKEALNYSYQLQNINNQLMNINNSMMKLSNSSADSLQQNQQTTQQKAQILQQNYNTLEQERFQIEELIRQYETLNSVQENGVINITSNYYKYIVYLVIAILLIVLLMKVNLTYQQRGGGYKNSPFIFILLACIIIFNSIIKK
jgi:hypothetical protein